jgi:putative transposase
MLNMTWEFKLEPTEAQVSEIEHILSVCRKVWNYALRERKDWFNSRIAIANFNRTQFLKHGPWYLLKSRTD